MDREISPLTGDYTSKQISTLQNAVYIRLTTPLGTWWADGRVGSLLHTIPKEKDLRHVGPLAQQYAEEALQPLIHCDLYTTPQRIINFRYIHSR